MTQELDPGRYEVKYALPFRHRQFVLDLVTDHVFVDSHASELGGPLMGTGARGYNVHSLYFDTPLLDDYFDRLAERQVRDRLRVRTYGEPGQGQAVFIENKRKLDNRVIKHRALLCTAEEWAEADAPYPWRYFLHRLEGGDRYTGTHFDRLIVGGERHPVSVVHYIREVFVGSRRADSRLRLTMDHQITATTRPDVRDLYAPGDLLIIPEDWLVLELKFDQDPPGWMRQLCRTLRLTAEPISKFGLSVAHGWRADRERELRYLTPRSIRPTIWPDARRWPQAVAP